MGQYSASHYFHSFPSELSTATCFWCLSSFPTQVYPRQMADLEGFADLIGKHIGPEGWEQVQQSRRLIRDLEPELKPKVYSYFLWAAWSRGRGGMPNGRPDLWDRV